MSTIDCPKCEHEHYPNGNHDDDAGLYACENCGFKFVVEIEYEPEYYATCVDHEFDPWELVGDVEIRYCKYCNKSEVKQEDRP